jgi:hypothetical protein
MTGFLNVPALAPAEDMEWRLVQPLFYATKDAEVVQIPAGFITDLASIPRALHAVIPVNGRHRPAAILHDYLYVVQDRSRKAADSLFLEAMELGGVRWTQRYVMYHAVRVGGWLPWMRNEKALREDREHYLRRQGLSSS